MVQNQPETVVAAEPLFDLDRVGASLDQLALSIRSKKLQGTHFGDIESFTPGKGYEITSFRDYQAGDPAKSISWKQTAHSVDQFPVVKTTFADKTPKLWVVTDMPDRRYATGYGDFSEQALGMSAVMSLVHISRVQGIETILAAASDREMFIGRSGGDSLLEIGYKLRKMRDYKPPQPEQSSHRKLFGRKKASSQTGTAERSTEIDHPIVEVMKRVGHVASRDTILIVSDFRDSIDKASEVPKWRSPLRTLASKGNDITAIEIIDPTDRGLLAGGFSRIGDSTTEGTNIGWVKNREEAASRYAAYSAEQQRFIDSTLGSLNVAHIKLSTDEPRWLSSLRNQLEAQSQRASTNY